MGNPVQVQALSGAPWKAKRSLNPGKDVRGPFLFLRLGKIDGSEIQALPNGNADRKGKVCLWSGGRNKQEMSCLLSLSVRLWEGSGLLG